jgi:transcriptional regulator
MGKSRPDLLHGTLDLLILQSLADGPMHGWAISRHIREISESVLEVNQGSLYPALYRLEKRGWISALWGVSEKGRRAKFYSLDPAERALARLLHGRESGSACRLTRRAPNEEWEGRSTDEEDAAGTQDDLRS